MGHAVYLSSAVPEDAERLAGALTELPCLAGRAVRPAVASAHGVLFDGLSEADARTCVQRLMDAGVSARVGDERFLRLPPPRRCKRITRVDSDLELVDGRGQTHRISTGDLLVLAVAQLPEEPAAGPEPGAPRPTSGAARGRSLGEHLFGAGSADAEGPGVPLLELIVPQPVRRFRIRADQFHYGAFLEDVPSAGSQANFGRLLHQLTRLAPGARPNRGARAWLERRFSGARYPGESAFARESSHHLFMALDGDPDRLGPVEPVEDPEQAAELRLAYQALAAARRPETSRRRSTKIMWAVLQLAGIAVLLRWFLRVMDRFHDPGF